MAALGSVEFSRRHEQARRDLRDDYASRSAVGGAPSRADLDPIPCVLPAAEWDALALGLAQRARLMNALLADAYGAQRMLRERIVPPVALLGHPAFLRPCHGHAPAGGRWLHGYAADLVRAADGRWMVSADRAQVPSGDGYALENRLAQSRLLPEAYRDLQVRRLASFYATTRRSLAGSAPRGNDNPRIVLLTPGPYSRSHAEHSYLARYLGFPLVEGADLVVRDEGVFLKTLAGLHAVEVIVRRQDDDFCDPLELRNDSSLGIPGLVQAARAGRVTIANALGSGCGDNGALIPALPRLCRLLLGEELVLPSVPSWWAGDSLAEITSRLDSLSIAPAFAGLRAGRFVPRELTARARAERMAQVQARPEAWVAQETIEGATVPAWEHGTMRARAFTLRAFAVADGEGYAVMSGGRCLLAADAQAPAAEKDLWILDVGPVAEVTLLPSRNTPVELRRGSMALPSRIADNLYWIGRYAERGEFAARLARAIAVRLREDAAMAVTARELVVMRAMSSCVGIADVPSASDAELASLVVGASAEGAGMRGCLSRLRTASLAVRDRLSNDTARIVAQLEREPERLSESMTGVPDPRVLDAVVTALAALAGMVTENTTRGDGWRFLDTGRRLERALLTTDMLAAALAGEDGGGESALVAALEMADSTITYRSRYLASLQPHAVLDLLLTDDTNPRSALFQLETVVAHLAALPRDREQALATPAERLGLGARTWLRLVDPLELCRSDERGGRPALEHLLEHLSSDLALLSEAITTQYLSHTDAPRALDGIGGGA